MHMCELEAALDLRPPYSRSCSALITATNNVAPLLKRGILDVSASHLKPVYIR
jgi:hypothetical protein